MSRREIKYNKMGMHTSIYRERDVRPDNYEKYSIRLFKGEKEIKLENPVLLREEFYFGKSVWAINEWFYQWRLKELKRWGDEPDEELSYEWIDEEYIYLDDLKRLLRDIRKVLVKPELAEKVLPMPKDLKLVRPKKETFDEKENMYVTSSEDDWENVPREEMYDDSYFEDLRWAEKQLEKLIKEDSEDLICDYIVDVG